MVLKISGNDRDEDRRTRKKGGASEIARVLLVESGYECLVLVSIRLTQFLDVNLAISRKVLRQAQAELARKKLEPYESGACERVYEGSGGGKPGITPEVGTNPIGRTTPRARKYAQKCHFVFAGSPKRVAHLCSIDNGMP